MDCKSFNEHLDNYEFLSRETKDEMSHHADKCEKCRAELDFMFSVMSTVKSLPKIEPPIDFMDKLNLRIDKEEKIKYGVASKAMRNLRRNWKQYTALAACFALVAVITSNGRYLIRNAADDDSGVIQREDVVIDGDGENRNIPAIVTDQNTGNDVQVSDSVEAAQAEGTNGRVNDVPDKAPDVIRPIRPSVARVTDSNSKDNISNDNLVIAPSHIETVSEVDNDNQDNNVTAYSVEAEDYQIAPANIQDDTIAAYALNNEIPEKINAHSADGDVRSGYMLASSSKISNSRGRNAVPIDEGKAIGMIKISADNVEEVINIVLEYAYDVDGDLYTTSSDNLSLLLSSLNSKGMNYKDYTPGYEGDITFKLVIS